MRRAVSKLLLALLSLEAVSMSSFALTGTLADLENAAPETSTKAIHAPQLSSAEEARIDKQLYDRMMKKARESRDPKAINAYLDLARKIKSKQLGGADENANLKSRVEFYQEQIKSTPASDQSVELYYELASSHDQLGHADDAAAVLSEMLKRFPDSPYAAEAHFRIAEAAFNRKQYQFATKEYKAVLNLGESKYKQQAQYFYAWSLYKDGRFEEAIPPFQSLIDSLQARALENKRDALLLQDSYRTLSSIFVQLGGVPALAKYYDSKPLTDEEALMYRQVGDRYREQKQLLDIAKVYEGFIQRHPQDAQAAVFSTDAITVYKEANFAQDIIRSKNDFVQRYDVDQNYFKTASPELQATLRPALKSQLDDLAKHYDAVGQTQKSTADYLHAADLYHKQLALATEPADMMRVQQRLAEALYNGGKFEDAIPYFEALAYKKPAAKPSEMGYFALLSYQAHAKELANQPAQKQDEWLDLQRVSSEQYATTFPADKSSSIVLLAMAGQYLDRKRFDIVDDLTRRVLALPNLSASDTKTASILKANADFDQQQWSEAESSYRQVLA
ncbi:MAG: tetratricopeptide repeat protein, partial [Candidatus Saccharibacteria bacterium]|nr:tetratricopeptide repeat protein [Moraxellaceae bacterium]